MVTENSIIRRQALASLKGRWGSAMLPILICGAVSCTAGIIPRLAYLSFLVTLPMAYGVVVWFLNFIRSNDGSSPEYATLFDGFYDYVRILITLLLVSIYTALWTLLFIVPGIVKGLSYSMTFYILKDYPHLKENRAIELSMAMMEGNKMKLFLMQLNFLMWIMLSLLTCGIALFWVVPYIQTTLAHFYEDVKRDYESRHIATTVE